MSDDDNEDVNIRIKRDTWKRLHNRKEPNDSHDDVIRRLLDEYEQTDEGNPKAAASS
jgi:predicted CopG family antitoxin